jgi:hypothetical protein
MPRQAKRGKLSLVPTLSRVPAVDAWGRRARAAGANDAWGRTEIGTVAGFPSVAELRDLVAAKDYEMAALAQGYANLAPSWVAQAPSAFLDFTNDWNALTARYAAARASAEMAFSLAKLALTLSESAIPAAGPWNAIQAALSPTPNTVTKGSQQDLFQRLQAAGGVVDLSHVPQPRASSDLDMRLLQSLNKVPAVLGGGDTSGFFGSGIPTWLVLSTGGLALLILLGPALVSAAPAWAAAGRGRS